MAEVARDAFSNRNYRLAAEMYERCLKERGPSFELYIGYGNSLAKCGQLREAVDVFSHCCRLGSVPQERLRHLATALIDAVSSGPVLVEQRTLDLSFACAVCEGVLVSPVTTPCGHTFCRKCVVREAGKPCRKCGQRVSGPPLETNVLVKGLTEKWWGSELRAARLRDEGDELFQSSEVEGALAKYNEAVANEPNNQLLLSKRSHTLYRLNRLQAALDDADAVVKLRPNWAKGHFRRGVALSALGRHEEALLALCICATLERNPQTVKAEVARSLHCLLVGPPLRMRCHSLLPLPPYSLGPRLRRRFLASSHPALNSSDCEDNSSGEEDFSQMNQQCFSTMSVTSLQENTKMHALLDRISMEVERLKRSEPRIADLSVSPGDIDLSDFECVLCCRTLWRPVTTPCGHTYCWMCLDRCLDYSYACPLCMASLADYLATSQKSVTEFVERALRVLIPGEYAARQMQHYQELSVQAREPFVPVFVCTTAFPGVPCPLYAYEPRYRVMVRRCVEAGTRQFGIAACLNKDAGLKRYSEFGTMLEIRDWLLLGDGSSILTTVGVRRFRVLARGERDGYDTAQVEFLRDQAVLPEHFHKLRELHERVRRKGLLWFNSMNPDVQAEIVRSFGHMPTVEEDWTALADGPAWPWWLLAILPLGQHLQAGILGTTSLEKRLRAIDKTLDQIQLWTGSVPQAVSRRDHSRTSERPILQQAGGSQQTTRRGQTVVRAS